MSKSNRLAKKAVGTKLWKVQSFSAGSERERWRDFPGRFVIGSGSMTMRTARAAGLGAGAERFVDDGLDGAGATAALGAATEAAVDLLWIARQVPGCAHGVTDILVANDVARTDNHETGRTFGDARTSIFKAAAKCKRKSGTFKQFQTDAERTLE